MRRMPIDPDLLEMARKMHDDLESAGLGGYASVVRLAVAKAVREQEQEEAFGEDRMRSCLEAQAAISDELKRLASTRPLTHGAVAEALSACVPHVVVLSSAAEGPGWYWSHVGPSLRRMSRLAEALRKTDPKSNASSGVHVKLADCMRDFRTEGQVVDADHQ